MKKALLPLLAGALALAPLAALSAEVAPPKQRPQKTRVTPNAILAEPDPTAGITFDSGWRYSNDQAFIYDATQNKIFEVPYAAALQRFSFTEYPVSPVPTSKLVNFEDKINLTASRAGGSGSVTMGATTGVASNAGVSCTVGSTTTTPKNVTGYQFRDYTSHFYNRELGNSSNQAGCPWIQPSYNGQVDGKAWDGSTSGPAVYSRMEMSITKRLREGTTGAAAACPALSDGRKYQGWLGVNLLADIGAESRVGPLGRLTQVLLRLTRNGAGDPVPLGSNGFNMLTPEICAQPADETCAGNECFLSQSFGIARSINYTVRGVSNLPLTGGQRLHGFQVISSADGVQSQTGSASANPAGVAINQKRVTLEGDDTCVQIDANTYNCPDTVNISSNTYINDLFALSKSNFGRLRANTSAGVVAYRRAINNQVLMMFDPATKDFVAWGNVNPSSTSAENAPNSTFMPISYLSSVPLSSSRSGGGGTVTFPVITINADPATVYTNQPFNVTWTVNGGSSCTAGGSLPGWNGPKGNSGTQSFTVPTAGTYTASLTCLHPDGFSRTRETTVTVSQEPPVEVSIGASPQTFVRGNSTTVTWNGNDALSCTASGTLPGWAGTKGVSGSQTITVPNAGDYTATITCTRYAVSGNDTVTVTATPHPPITINRFEAVPNPVEGDSSMTLFWETTNATACTGSAGNLPGWNSTSRPINGSYSRVMDQLGTFTAQLRCTNPDRVQTADESIEVVPPPPPTVNFSGTPTALRQGETTTFTWSSTGARNCAAGGDVTGWSGAKTMSGTLAVRVSNAAGTRVARLTCTNLGGSTTREVTLTISQPDGGCTCPAGYTENNGICSNGSTTFECGNNSNNPGASINHTPQNPYENQTFTTQWACSNAYGASAAGGGGFSGTVPTNGSRATVFNSPGARTLTITCSNSVGSTAASTVVNVQDANPPDITFTVPPKVYTGDQFSISWAASGPGLSSCTGGGWSAWNGSKTAGSDTQNFTPANNQAGNYTLTLTCSGYGGSSSQSRPLQIALKPQTTFNITNTNNTADRGTNFTSNWTTQNMTSCTAAGDLPGWTGSKSTTSSNTQIPATTPGTYTVGITCSGPEGSLTSTRTVTVREVVNVSSFTITPTTVTQGDSATFSWASTGANRCEGTGNYPGWARTGLGPSGSVAVAPNSTGNFSATITCYNDTYGTTGNRSASGSVVGVVTFNTFNVTGQYFDQNYVLSLSTSNAQSCTGTGDFPGWSGRTVTPNGTTNMGVPNTAGTWTVGVTCTNAAGRTTSSSQQVTASWRPVAIGSFYASPATLNNSGGNTTIYWASSYASSCSASGNIPGFSGALATNGNRTVSLPANTTSSPQTYTGTLTCTGNGSPASQNVTVTVNRGVTINSMTVSGTYFNDNYILDLSTTGATSCTGTGDFPGWAGKFVALNGQTDVGIPGTAGTWTVGVSCTNGGTPVTASRTVSAIWRPVVITSFSPQTTSMGQSGGSNQISWTTSYANSCTASGGPGWNGAVSVNGNSTLSFPPNTGGSEQTYSLQISCSGNGGSDSRTMQITVAGARPEVSISVPQSTYNANDGIFITWNAGSNSTSCNATGNFGPWAGSKNSSGSNTEGIGAPTNSTTQTYTIGISCSNAAGTGTASTSFTVNATVAELCARQVRFVTTGDNGSRDERTENFDLRTPNRSQVWVRAGFSYDLGSSNPEADVRTLSSFCSSDRAVAGYSYTNRDGNHTLLPNNANAVNQNNNSQHIESCNPHYSITASTVDGQAFDNGTCRTKACPAQGFVWGGAGYDNCRDRFGASNHGTRARASQPGPARADANGPYGTGPEFVCNNGVWQEVAPAQSCEYQYGSGEIP